MGKGSVTVNGERTASVGPVPWPTERPWKEAQAALGRSLVLGGARLAPARGHAEAIAHYLRCLADLFEQLAPDTCAVCQDPCCRRANVWLDFKDLLYLHLSRASLPPHQLRRNLHEPCRYLGRRGCRLPRLSRPWICTWYICPAQREVIARDIPGGRARIDGLRTRIKSRRAAMEAAYLDGLGVSAASYQDRAASIRSG